MLDEQIIELFFERSEKAISALDSKSEVTCTIVDGETFIASGTNSIASYVGGVTDEATLKVASAMMKYCESAYNYFYRNK